MKNLFLLAFTSVLFISTFSSCEQNELEEIKPKIEDQKNRPGNTQF